MDAHGHGVTGTECFLRHLPLAAANRGMPFALMLNASSDASFFPDLLVPLQGRVFSQLRSFQLFYLSKFRLHGSIVCSVFRPLVVSLCRITT